MSDAVVDVAIVGGGPAGCVLAARLGETGVQTVVLERAPQWRWRAGGVFTSPAAPAALERAGLPATTIATAARPIPAMRIETRGGSIARLTYGAEQGRPPAVGFDRSRLDPSLEARARAAGVAVRRGSDVRTVELASDRPATLRLGDGEVIRATIVVGADGTHSLVARVAGVARPARLPSRVGLTWHAADHRGDGPLDARLVVVRDGYVGLAPIPGGRVNIGIVLGPSWRRNLARFGAAATARVVLDAVPAAPDDPTRWSDATVCDQLAGAAPLGGRVTQLAGPGWLLVGDAAGFLDPFTGEGLHRALVSTELAGPAIRAMLDDRHDRVRAAGTYDRAMRRRFGSKDAVSWLVQSFLARPRLFEYAARRLADRPDVRATMGLVIGDLVPASRGLDPRFLAALLAP